MFISLEKVLAELDHTPLYDYRDAISVVDMLNSMPKEAFKNVIFCKDCKYRSSSGVCSHPRLEGILPTAYPLDFCSYGEAKNE